jgi:hypothetical protein
MHAPRKPVLRAVRPGPAGDRDGDDPATATPAAAVTATALATASAAAAAPVTRKARAVLFRGAAFAYADSAAAKDR